MGKKVNFYTAIYDVPKNQHFAPFKRNFYQFERLFSTIWENFMVLRVRIPNLRVLRAVVKNVHFYRDIYEVGNNSISAPSEPNSPELRTPESSMIQKSFTSLLVLNANLRTLKEERTVERKLSQLNFLVLQIYIFSTI